MLHETWISVTCYLPVQRRHAAILSPPLFALLNSVRSLNPVPSIVTRTPSTTAGISDIVWRKLHRVPESGDTVAQLNKNKFACDSCRDTGPLLHTCKFTLALVCVLLPFNGSRTSTSNNEQNKQICESKLFNKQVYSPSPTNSLSVRPGASNFFNLRTADLIVCTWGQIECSRS